MELQRVQKIIANAGLMSRRDAEMYIEQGRVKVNGRIINVGDKATLEDKITVDGREIKQPRKRYIMFNKPGDCVTSLADPTGLPTIFKYIREKERLIPVGRLDFKTEGLLLLTNDGDFANKVMHPRYGVEKTYIVHLQMPLRDKDKTKIERGVNLEDGMTSPARITYLDEDREVVEIVVHEGRKRIVRRMFYHLGYKTNKLIRTRIGKLYLGNLKRAAYRDLKRQEIDMIFQKHDDRKKKELPRENHGLLKDPKKKTENFKT